ncbi:MAG: hypothetical protein K0S65_2552 [Labilithrix sp.]|nr:hypothetical protein [Labilithrix sp.]
MNIRTVPILALLVACHSMGPAAHISNERKNPRMDVTLLTKAQPKEWYQPGSTPLFLADVLDETSASPMSVGFALYAAGASNDWTVSYDETLVITKGRFTVIANGRETTARAGEAIFLPKGTPLTYRADEATELVYVTFPHWAEATRKSEHAKALEAYKPVPPAATSAASK